MKIAQSSVNMVSNHTYYEENTLEIQSAVMTRTSFMDSLKDQEKLEDSLEISENSGEQEPLQSQTYSNLKPSTTEYLSPFERSLEEQFAELRASLLNRILSLLQILGGGDKDSEYQKVMTKTSEMLTSNMFLKVTSVQQTHVEQETTTFSGLGQALTEDGRQIDFNVSFSLSSTFTRFAQMNFASAMNFIDPLVINVGSGITHISDQTFYFDLDNDGEDDKISNLGSGSGFLAYDRNGDGKINNGSELFGTRSGNGFLDLAAYDHDRNGWIDENDEIYDKLRIWIRNEDGTDSLLSLKEADVGAICLQNADTEFVTRNSSFEVAAMMRASGIFLRESGGVGTLQQVDLAAIKDEPVEEPIFV